ncbi:MAG: endonuclease domain-containing protein [Deltaproteobacteria bacterium]|nr:endonuclease domain-containing protein [Deltaproteobacteria bacterium]
MRDRARALRRNLTPEERLLWRALRGGRRVGGAVFRRQAVIGPFIADFACLERRLIVELDGSQHVARHPYDSERTAWLQSQGFRVLRFWNHQVNTELDAVVALILEALGAPPGLGNLPHAAGGGG